MVLEFSRLITRGSDRLIVFIPKVNSLTNSNNRLIVFIHKVNSLTNSKVIVFFKRKKKKKKTTIQSNIIKAIKRTH